MNVSLENQIPLEMLLSYKSIKKHVKGVHDVARDETGTCWEGPINLY